MERALGACCILRVAVRRQDETVRLSAITPVAFAVLRVYPFPEVKLIKQQVNGNEQVVLKTEASPADLREEAERLERMFGYQIKTGERADRVVATHPFFRGKYVLSLEPE